MGVKTRIKKIRIIEKMNKNEEFVKRLGLENASFFQRETKEKRLLGS